MQQFLLFVDTETTGLPSGWTKPYSVERNWPSIAQLAWVVYTLEGELVKTENHYIRVPAGRMRPSATAIHGLTPTFLEQHGEACPTIMQRFFNDLRTYCPLVVGHYMRLDFHMIGVEFYRTGLPNLLAELPTLCTMQTSQRQAQAQERSFLRLGELHEYLFKEPMVRQHDALIDAQATARCFFELRRLGDLSDETISAQPQLSVPSAEAGMFERYRSLWLLFLLVAGVLSLLFFWLYG
ncbi:3'-5' exonuclease [Hymenobacter volaticus]|uniref:3'-5' exonuclease n=1 Tax=Hymenobacter volaticus TaxID=2932254 RepID=A0ABY4G9K4_9BACT|nr:3'-5' exonuclease [Hymenobacter volaticus]UOQ67585.1 3'-5' exonuclease [Hymenobacter volaticus]